VILEILEEKGFDVALRVSLIDFVLTVLVSSLRHFESSPITLNLFS
jgi:hypothetical protein